MIPYILHVTAITTVCFLFYKLFLQKETFYLLNRWTLLGCLAVSFALPLLPVPRDWSWRECLTAKQTQPVAPPMLAKVEPVQEPPNQQTDRGGVNTREVVITTALEPERGVSAVRQAGRRRPSSTQGGGRAKQSERSVTVAKADVNAIPVAKIRTAASTGAVIPAVQGTSSPTSVTSSSTPMASRPNPVTGSSTPVVDLFVVLRWLFYLYLFGLVVFGGNFLLQVAVLVYQSYARPVIRDGRFRIVEITGNRAPCSFGNTIFINPANYDWETYNQILIHEKVHVSGRHTLDILLAEMAVVLQWFNPFVWLYRREVENNLEFLTDASVLEHREVERSAYQLSLLRVSAPHLPFSITNNYNQSLLKRRIVMMNSKRSSLHTVWKYFFLIPLLTGLVCALNKPAAYGAGSKKWSPDATIGSGLPAGKLGFFMAGLLADTSKKPGTNSPSRHDSLRKADAPVTVEGTGSSDGDRESSTANAYLDQALQQAQADNAVQVNVNTNEQVALAKLAQLDGVGQVHVEATEAAQVKADVKMAMHMDMAMRAKTDVDVNVGLIRIEGDTDVMEGAWFGTSSSESKWIQFELKRESENGFWNNTFGVEKTEFNPYPGQGNVEFKLTREAGTISFKGQFDGQEGFGHYQFIPNEAYFNALKQMGVDEIEGRRFSFFTLNIKKEYAGMLLHSFPHLSTRELISCAAQHIDQDFIKYWMGSGISDLEPRTLVSLKAQHIDRAYVEELKAAGYDHLAWRELISLKAQHVDGAYIRDLKAAGYDHLEPRELNSMKAQQIDGAYVRSLGRGKDNDVIPVRDVISYKSMRIDSSYIATLRTLGYSNLDRNQLFSLYSQHVSAEYIKGFQNVGYKDLSARELVSLKSMGITPEFVKGFQEAGYKNLEVRQLCSFKSQNITPEFIKGWRDLGYEDINANQLASLKSMGVTPDFVREFNKIGFDHIPVNMLSMLKSTGVNADYVSKMKEKGFVSKDLGKYIRLKNDFN